MRFTDNYRLGSVVAGEPLDPLEDSRRMLAIDRQLRGLYEVFGDGVIEGWDLIRSIGLDISVTPGRGHIGLMSSISTIPSTVAMLASATNFVFASLVEDSSFSRGVSFTIGATATPAIDSIFLGTVVTDETSVISIDTNGRNDISFIDTIKQIVAEHRHRGGTNDPSRINLAAEVTGQLPGTRIDNLDASKITSGIIPAARIPVLEHGELENSGVLTHAQLDSFVRALENPNTRLLGELSAVNLMQLYLSNKHIWNDVDQFATNLLVMIPGITDDAFSDFLATTALVDKFNHTIQGIPSTSGKLHTVTLTTEADFRAVFARVNLDVLTGQAGPSAASLQLTRPTSELIVEDFDNVLTDATLPPGWVVETTSSITSPDNTTFLTDASKKADGVFSAKFHIDQQLTVQSSREFDSSVDWTEFNVMEVAVETLEVEHGQIRMQILGSGIAGDLPVLDDFLLLSANETTKGFKTVTRDISTIDRSEIGGIKIYTDTSIGWDPSLPINVNVDAIKVVNTLFFDTAGFIRFRLQTPQKTKWAAISWDGDENGGDIVARARTGPNFEVFDQTISATFGDTVEESGGDPNVADNTNVEFELAISSSVDRTASPLVRSVTISFITASADKGVIIDSVDDFERGEDFKNTKVIKISGEVTDDGEDNGSVIIDGRVDVGDVAYGLFNSVQQSTFDINPVPVLGIVGNDLFTSPLQAATRNLEEIFIKRRVGFDGVAHVSRQEDRTYLLADTFNDRVFLMDRDGNVIRGLVTNNVRNETDLYPLTSILNRRRKTLFVAWSKNISLDETFDLTKFHLNAPGLSLTLSPAIDTVSSISGLQGDQGQISGNVNAILLGDVHFAELEAYFETQGDDAPLFLDIETDAVSDGIDVANSNFASLAGPRGLPVSVTDVLFVPGIYRPVSLILSEFSGNWIVANAKPLLTTGGRDPVTGVSREEITSVVEFEPDLGTVEFSNDSVDFSAITLGGISEFNERFLAVAGIVKDEFPPATGVTASVTTQGLGTGTLTVNKTTTTTETQAVEGAESTTTTEVSSEFGEVNNFRGRVKLIEKRSGRVVFDQPTSDGTFASDVQVDDDDLLVVERFFEPDPTSPVPVIRGRVVRMDDDGNIWWQYGLGSFEGFNDARVLDNGNIMTSS